MLHEKIKVKPSPAGPAQQRWWGRGENPFHEKKIIKSDYIDDRAFYLKKRYYILLIKGACGSYYYFHT